MTHDFSVDFLNKNLLVFKDMGNKTPSGHITGTRCRPDITAAFEKDWLMDDLPDWALTVSDLWGRGHQRANS
jgi:hypothetical protein